MSSRLLTIHLSQLGCDISAEAGQTVLGAALAAGLRLVSSCRNGTCRACRCRLRSGQVDYVVDWPGLSREERQEGWILPCVARPLTDVEIDARLDPR